MAQIGTFTRDENGTYAGTIKTLTLNVKATIKPCDRDNDRAPDFRKGISPTEFALAWVLNNKLISAAITGPRTEEHWDSYIRALDVRLDAEDEALVDRLVTTGHPSTAGFNDPSHPVEGRVPRSGADGADNVVPLARAVA